jgi:error-prone DNA polymerase
LPSNPLSGGSHQLSITFHSEEWINRRRPLDLHSFALIAYASAYLKCHYLAAFTAAILNNQPMGLCSPSTLVKDAQLHGLRVKPVDVLRSDWFCTLEPEAHREASNNKGARRFAMRLGLLYARGLRQEAGEALVNERQRQVLDYIQDLAMRVPEPRKSDLTMLAQIGAPNSLGENIHRRDALWQVEYAGRLAGPLLRDLPEQDEESPLAQMTLDERLADDFHGTGVTVGPHPMAYHRVLCRAWASFVPAVWRSSETDGRPASQDA